MCNLTRCCFHISEVDALTIGSKRFGSFAMCWNLPILEQAVMGEPFHIEYLVCKGAATRLDQTCHMEDLQRKYEFGAESCP